MLLVLVARAAAVAAPVDVVAARVDVVAACATDSVDRALVVVARLAAITAMVERSAVSTVAATSTALRVRPRQ